MSKIAFVGDRDSVWGFRGLGVDVYPVADESEAREALERAAGGEHAIVFVTEDVYEACPEDIARYRDQALPTVTVLPGVTGSRGIAAGEIKRAVSAAIGADILGEPSGDADRAGG
jgi:V/A-type H+-transporting ATPase subunit F